MEASAPRINEVAGFCEGGLSWEYVVSCGTRYTRHEHRPAVYEGEFAPKIGLFTDFITKNSYDMYKTRHT